MPYNDKDQVLRRAREALSIAQQALKDAHEPARRAVAIRNVVVFGRSVTNIVENLRSRVSAFDDWYKPRTEAMAADPLVKFFYKLRSQILKQGTLGTARYVDIEELGDLEDLKRRFPAPANARNFIFGDELGGAGWRVEVAPGTFEMYYVSLPAEIGVVGLAFKGAPSDEDALVLCRRYLDAIAAFLTAAEARWL